MKSTILEITHSDKIDVNCGTKAMTLAELSKLGISVPVFYAISSRCFDRYIKDNNIISPLDFYSSPRNEFDFFKNSIVDSFEVTGEKIPNGEYMVRSSSIPHEKVDLQLFSSMISGAFESYFADSISNVYKKVIDVWESVYTQKAHEQCRILSDKPFVKSIGVIIQQYIKPTVSGVLHTNLNGISVNWIYGHLSKIVSGETLGNNIDAYFSNLGDAILRSKEEDILLIKNNGIEEVFVSLLEQAKIIKQHFKTELEIEWIFDGQRVWIVQSQTLLSKSQ